MKKYIVFLFNIMMIVVMVCSFTACGTESNTADEIPFYTTDEDVFRIETKYGDLYYPEKWRDSVNVTFDEDNDPYKVHFVKETDEKNIPLFDLVFDSEQGQYLGILTIDEKDINVNVIFYDGDIDENDYSEEEYNDLCAMCEDINVIISKLIEGGNFEIAE